jgi:hypothetical protein
MTRTGTVLHEKNDSQGNNDLNTGQLKSWFQFAVLELTELQQTVLQFNRSEK